MEPGNPHAAEASLGIARLAEAAWSAHRARARRDQARLLSVLTYRCRI